jgi:hypothetical protein
MTRVCRRFHPLIVGAVAIVLAAMIPVPMAHAGKGPLEGQPAVRRRQELRKGRLELGLASETSVAAQYKHTVGVGPRLEYHLSDMLSVGAVAIYGLLFIDTNTTEEIRDSLTLPPGSQALDPDDPTPSPKKFDEHLNTIPLHGAAYIALTPVSGKMSLLGTWTVNYDIYGNLGYAFAQTKSTFKGKSALEPEEAFPLAWNDNPENAGFRSGLGMGLGLHVYIDQALALDFALRNYLFSDNPSGLDTNGDFIVTEDDRRFQSHWFFGLGVSGYLPSMAAISP